MDERSLNPYHPPSGLEIEPDASGGQPAPKSSLPGLLVKWFMICFITAAPSLFLGGVLSQLELPLVMGMLAGISAFVLFFTAMEMSREYQSLMMDWRFKRAVRIGIGIRIAMSVCFPIGVLGDAVVGQASINIVSALAPFELTPGDDMEPNSTFVAYFLTTLVQGTLLSTFLLGFILLVLGLITLASANSDGPDEPVDDHDST